MSFFRRILKGDWMQTSSGGHYFPAAPRVEDVQIADIAHHLSMLCRYTGACRWFYSVAEHSVHVSFLVSPEHALCGLLHDATETYLNDLNRPVKHNWLALWGYRYLERKNWRVISQKFGLPLRMPEEVHTADNLMLRTEQTQIMPYCEHTDAWAREAHPTLELGCWSPAEAEAKFMSRFYELTRGRKQPVRKTYEICDSGWRVRVRPA